MKRIKTFSWFRKVAFIEGISYLVLLLIAMPLKYFVNFPIVVTIVGGLHGALFVAFIILAVAGMIQYKKNLIWLIKAFLSSILPFGTFWMDHHQWRKEELAAIKA